eukprot:6528550-Alexandrium_andersonii.AAC.1
MSASLVGSEMCIRDSLQAVATHAGLLIAPAPFERLQLHALHVVHIQVVQFAGVQKCVGRSYGRGSL